MTITTLTAAERLAATGFERIAMQQFTPAERDGIREHTDYLEVVIARYLGGRIKESGLAYFLYGSNAPQIRPELEAAFQDTCDAYITWRKAEVGDVDIHSLEPELAHPEVWAERCRVLLDDELAALAKELAA